MHRLFTPQFSSARGCFCEPACLAPRLVRKELPAALKKTNDSISIKDGLTHKDRSTWYEERPRVLLFFLWLDFLCAADRFMAAMSPSGCLSVVLNPRATPEDQLKAYFQCVVFWEKVCVVCFR